MEPILNDDGDLQVPENIEIPVDPDAVDEVNPDFKEIGGSEPTTETLEEEEPTETTEESIVDDKPAEEPATEPEPSETPESSLTSEPEPEPETEPEPTQVEQPEVVLDEESVLSFLSEKLGKEIGSIEDLTKEPTNPLDTDEELKALVEWREKTGRPISDYGKFQKDYGAMSNEEVAREYLRYKYEDFTPEEIELELSSYLPSEDDFDNDAARKSLNLKKLASEGRKELNSLRLELDKPVAAKLTQEQQQAIEFYQKTQEQQESIQKSQAISDKNITEAIKSVETLELPVDEGLTIEFKPDQNARKSLKEYMAMPNWYNKDNTINGAEIVKDSFFLQNREAIFKEIYKQGLDQGKALIEKETSNTTLSNARTTQESGGAPQTDDIVIEGLDDMMPRYLTWGNKK